MAEVFSIQNGETSSGVSGTFAEVPRRIDCVLSLSCMTDDGGPSAHYS